MNTPAINIDEQNRAFNSVNMPIPGASLTATPGSVPYERPPQYNDVDDAMDFLFKSVLQPSVQRDVLRLLDAGVPVVNIAETILMHGTQEGKWNMDLALILMEPFSVVLYGIGERAGIDVKLFSKKANPGIDTSGFKKQIKEAAKSEESASKVEPKLVDKEAVKGLLSRPGV